MPSNELVNYIISAKENGQNENQIRADLTSAGLDVFEIQKALKAAALPKKVRARRILTKKILLASFFLLVIAGIYFGYFYFKPKPWVSFRDEARGFELRFPAEAKFGAATEAVRPKAQLFHLKTGEKPWRYDFVLYNMADPMAESGTDLYDLFIEFDKKKLQSLEAPSGWTSAKGESFASLASSGRGLPPAGSDIAPGSFTDFEAVFNSEMNNLFFTAKFANPDEANNPIVFSGTSTSVFNPIAEKIGSIYFEKEKILNIFDADIHPFVFDISVLANPKGVSAGEWYQQHYLEKKKESERLKQEFSMPGRGSEIVFNDYKGYAAVSDAADSKEVNIYLSQKDRIYRIHYFFSKSDDPEWPAHEKKILAVVSTLEFFEPMLASGGISEEYGASSPEELVEKFKSAIKQQNLEQIARCFHPAVQSKYEKILAPNLSQLARSSKSLEGFETLEFNPFGAILRYNSDNVYFPEGYLQLVRERDRWLILNF